MATRAIMLAGLAALLVPAPAFAETSTERQVEIAIPAQRLDKSLMDLCRRLGLQLIFTDAELRRRTAPALKGQYNAAEALDRLLRGSGFDYRFTNANTVRIYRSTASTRRAAMAQPASYGAAAQQSDEMAGTRDTPPPPPPLDIVVTGSRIRRDGFDTPSPVVVVGGEDIEESGESEIGELLADFPAITSNLNEGTVTGNVQNSGLSSIELRNLGDNRTLVLIDGRRTVSNSANGNRVSLNTIPQVFVDRVEVITGGTSSIYGSDAVAGVVNIITKSNEVGFDIRARGEITEQGDGEEINLDASWGTRFAQDRGYFLIGGEYERRWGIRAADRDYASAEVDFDYDEGDGINEFDTLYVNDEGELVSGDQPASTFPPNVFGDRSGFTPGGVFYGVSSARDRFYDANGLVPLGPDLQTGQPVAVGTSDNGNSGYFLPNRDGYNQRLGRALVNPRTRYLVAAKLDFDVSDATTLFAQAHYTRVDSTEIREPNGIGFDSTFPVIDPVTGLSTEQSYGRIACRRATGSSAGPCNPFVPDEIRADVSTRGTGVAWDRRFVEVGDQLTENEREVVRVWAGARGEAWDDWIWEASLGYGEFNQDQLRRNEINALNLQAGLDAEVGPDGAIRCADPAARAAGCVPVNLFGVGSITPAAADWIRADLRQRATIKQENFQAFTTGNLFDLPAGLVGAAFGIEYRKDSQEIRGDELSQFGGTSGNPIPNFGGSIAAFEGFGEFTVPIVKDQPGFHLLSADLSARVAEYDIENVGTVFSYRAGLQWAPVEDLRFRAQFARAQRAPDLTELFSPPRGDFDDAADPCNGVTPSSTGTIAANCLAEPGIQADFQRQLAEGIDPADVEFDQEGASIFSPNAGNRDLKEETADTWTLGVVATPRFLPGFSLAVDYYNIQIDDAIQAYTNQDILVQCYDNALDPSENRFCGDITRNPNNGQLAEVIQREFNLAGFNVSGIDVAVQYRFGLEDVVGLPGEIDLRYNATHALKYEFEFEGIDGLQVTDRRGDLSEGNFKFRARGAIGYRLDGLRLRWTVTYFGDVLDSRARLDQFREIQAGNPAAETPLFLFIDDVWEHDLYASYRHDFGSTEVRFFGGVNNVFDRVSPQLPTGDVFSGRLTNINTNYDIAGRRFFLGAALEF